ncbi:hypothetical protein CBR_g21129 [Chara braunii]|uniref:RNA methyltransferase n=1 Tax=Chara braunii TaxID=69332 RepID=A0A388L0R1_CHABU|nr:hypothetical protein CBR_g21129 [Chara braunii]|eukprot:GBG75887.1 hypothetical protein CBR_g21129 [Chara braunii]
MVLCVDPTYAQFLVALGSLKCKDEEDTEKDADEDTEEVNSDEEDEDMREEEDEQGQDMNSWDYVQRYVRSLELDKTVEVEVRLAHHKHLRNLNLRAATKVEDTISLENRYEILRKERELNEFYAAQYSMKTRIDKNRITVDTRNYEQHFIWPKSYAEQRAERRAKKNKREEQQGSTDAQDQDTASTTADEESMDELRRQAAILEAQVKVLRDKNRELDENCITLKDVAGGAHKEIEAAARLDACNSPKRRTLIPFHWNSSIGTWEIAYHRSNSLISVQEQECAQKILQETISDSVPTEMHILGSKKEAMEEWKDQENEMQLADLRPLLLDLGESASLKGDLCWVPWKAVESMPYGLLGGELAAERAAMSSALVTTYALFTLSPKLLELKLRGSVSTRKEIARPDSQTSDYGRLMERALPIRLIHVSKGQSMGAKVLTQEYAEKLSRYCGFDEVQIRPNPKNVSDANLQVEHEAERVMRLLKPRDWVIALDERGRTITSEQLADLIADAGDSGWLGLAFCIGGPYGHGADIIARANDKIKLSSLVLNHEIARVVLMEQLYRAWTILRGENYHH